MTLREAVSHLLDGFCAIEDQQECDAVRFAIKPVTEVRND